MSTDLERRTRFEGIAAEVYDPVQRYLGRRVHRDQLDDVFNEVLLTLWRRLDDIPDGAVLPWTYGVARRTLANARRSDRRRLALVDRIAVVDGPDVVPDPADGDQFPEVRAALDSLPEADREVLALWAWEQLEPREIAVVLDTTANAISLRLTRARAKLADALERQTDAGAGQEPDERTRSVDHDG